MRYGLKHIYLLQVAAASLLSPDASSAGVSAAASSAGASATASSAGASAAASTAGDSATASSDFAAFASKRSFDLVPNSALL